MKDPKLEDSKKLESVENHNFSLDEKVKEN